MAGVPIIAMTASDAARRHALERKLERRVLFGARTGITVFIV